VQSADAWGRFIKQYPVASASGFALARAIVRGIVYCCSTTLSAMDKSLARGTCSELRPSSAMSRFPRIVTHDQEEALTQAIV